MPAPAQRTTIKVQAERTVLAALRYRGCRYDRQHPFDELRALAEQAGAVVVGTLEQFRDRPDPGTFLGRGKVRELTQLCDALDATTIIFDHDLSPRHIANLERETCRKVIDRSELILDIFAGRATTHEAKLQVELAQLEYTYPRLRAMWSHLERIVGPGGVRGIGTRGPGEQQIEIDRRLVQRRRNELLRQLRQIQARKHRAVLRRNAEHFTVGLVGYTNAGKSTLFNSLTAGGAYADDRPFATLVTRTRRWDVGRGLAPLLADTVGFVRDLPHNLIASFRATLEEATYADLLLIVLDISDPAAELHLQTVHETLDAVVGPAPAERPAAGTDGAPPPRIVLLNKCDRLRDNTELLIWQRRLPDAIPICALPGRDGRLARGGEALAQRVQAELTGPPRLFSIAVDARDTHTIARIESQTDVLRRDYNGTQVALLVRAGERQMQRLRWAAPAIAEAMQPAGPAGDGPGWTSAAVAPILGPRSEAAPPDGAAPP